MDDDTSAILEGDTAAIIEERATPVSARDPGDPQPQPELQPLFRSASIRQARPPPIDPSSLAIVNEAAVSRHFADCRHADGRLPHPERTPQLNSSGADRLLAELQKVATPSDVAAAPGLFPTMVVEPTLGLPHGKCIPGNSAPKASHSSRDWWETAGGSSHGSAPPPALDDKGEADLQEQMLRAVFPKLFLEHYHGLADFVPPSEQNVTWGGALYDLLECDLYHREYSRSDSAHPDTDGQHSLNSALGRALDARQGDVDERLRVAGLQDNLWLSGISPEKQAQVRVALDKFNQEQTPNEAIGLQQFMLDLRPGEVRAGSACVAGSVGGHCRMRVMEKVDEHTIAIIGCNNASDFGFGTMEVNLPGEIRNAPTAKPVWGWRVDHIDVRSEAFNDLANWYFNVRDTGYYGGDDLNGFFFDHISPSQLVGKTIGRAINDSPDMQPWNMAGTEGMGGECGQNSPKSQFKYLLRRVGCCSLTDSKEVRYASRLFLVAQIGEDLAGLRAAEDQPDARLAVAAVCNAGYQVSALSP